MSFSFSVHWSPTSVNVCLALVVSLGVVAFVFGSNGYGAEPLERPFRQVVKVPPLPAKLEWLNSPGPLSLEQLRGKFVLLDFWTYCCINCMHILPELKKLEQAFPKELVVIGVHSAKFKTERETGNIRDAIARYEIEHPVVNDSDMEIWAKFGVNSWPTIVLIDPDGFAVWGRSGEFKAEDVSQVLHAAIPYYRQAGSLRDAPAFESVPKTPKERPLCFPGKLLADEAGKRLFVSDSNHNRIVVASLQGERIAIIGSGRMGSADGSFAEASFNHPQGLALVGGTLYVADTENHLLRAVDLASRKVVTVAGTGQQARGAWPGMATSPERKSARFVDKPLVTPLSSPWSVAADSVHLYVAMAGSHQIWRMPLNHSEIGPYAGNGREDIVDGLLLPPEPYLQKPVNPQTGKALDPPMYASFAQPSGLAIHEKSLFVADSEGSSIRVVPLDAGKRVETLVGTSHLASARLFTFGDEDGRAGAARLQHPLDVVHHDGKVYVADTYNNKIKVVDAGSGEVETLVGDGAEGASDEPARFNEPGGVSCAAGMLYVADTNNHLIRVVDLASRKVRTLEISGLEPGPAE